MALRKEQATQELRLVVNKDKQMTDGNERTDSLPDLSSEPMEIGKVHETLCWESSHSIEHEEGNQYEDDLIL